MSDRLAACAGPTKKPMPMPATQNQTSVVVTTATVEAIITPTNARIITNFEPSHLYQARADVFDYIERFYNPTRRHSTLGYLSPMDFEKKAGVG